jgi:hypothetical protein
LRRLCETPVGSWPDSDTDVPSMMGSR